MSARKSVVSSTTEAITATLAGANGRRRERTLSYSEAIQAIREALRDGYGYANGGTVANSYGYAASQTQVGAISANDAVVVTICQSSASKGSALLLPFRRGTSEEKVAAIIDSSTQRPYRGGGIRMSRRTARAIVAAQDHADAVAAADRIPFEYRNCDTLLTASDSIAAGNCQSETVRVQSWFAGREAIPAREVLAAIVERAPSLIPFAIRAIQYAQRQAPAAV